MASKPGFPLAGRRTLGKGRPTELHLQNEDNNSTHLIVLRGGLKELMRGRAQNGAGPRLGPCKRLLAPPLNQRTSLSLKVSRKHWLWKGRKCSVCFLAHHRCLRGRLFLSLFTLSLQVTSET